MIREIDTENLDKELDRLHSLSLQFFKSSSFLNGFKIEVFKKTWNGLYEAGVGIIFILEIDDEFCGAIGGLKFPDINTGILTATECFWFVNEEHRGRGLALLKRFEIWVKEQGCKKIIMVHLSDLMSEAVKKIYIRKGYTEMETHYIKEVV